MNQKFQLSCESTVDIPYEYVNSRNIPVLFYSYMVDDKEYFDDMARTENAAEDFFNMMIAGGRPVTSQLNSEAYREFFEKLLEKGNVLHITFGSGLTNSYNNARLVAEELNAKYTDRKIVVIDSMCGCCGYGILVDSAADLRDEGKSMEEIEKWVIENRQTIHHMFFSTDLSHLKKCGRISGVAAFVGGLLNICPIFYLDRSGHIVTGKKARGFRKAMSETVSEIVSYIKLDKPFGKKIYIAHSNCLDKALETRTKLAEALGIDENIIHVGSIGTVIGSHCGAGTVSIYFVGDERPE